ncbi:hypothetical protein [Haloarcula onubensis]|uniref:Transporter n=1 Tax=Haloarcula onubensis TaxID=2950539 RepID=A0ABU2FNH3_9EURY|nr:hypothetical protein [Halomicroarcula sp. S3CR25-11]MDS0282310.1 hypothetical protein [Halomicroarcula sp. S3CR25-11]
MDSALLGMVVLFVAALLTGVTGFLLLPAAFSPVFASVAAVSGLGLGVTGYAIRKV